MRSRTTDWCALLIRGLPSLLAAALVLGILPAPAAERSRTLRAEFMRLNPCPSTGKSSGACPGYQVDHREALICGGRDELGNLQWLGTEEHKAKTRVEVKLCRTHEPRRRPMANAGDTGGEAGSNGQQPVRALP